MSEQGNSDVADICTGIESGSWVDPMLGGPASGLNALGTIVDPLATVTAWGVPWLIEHVRPLHEALDWLAGDPAQIEAHARTWTNVANEVRDAAQTVSQQAGTDLASWAGSAAEAYREHLADQVRAADVVARIAEGLSSAVIGAGLVVAVTRELVRDAIAEFVSTLAVQLKEWLAEEACTIGSATPWVVSQVAALVGRWVDTITVFIRGLITSMKRLSPLVRRLMDALEALEEMLPRLHRGGQTHSSPPPAS